MEIKQIKNKEGECMMVVDDWNYKGEGYKLGISICSIDSKVVYLGFGSRGELHNHLYGLWDTWKDTTNED